MNCRWTGLLLAAMLGTSIAVAQTTVTTPGGTTNTVPLFTGSATVGNSAITQSGGNVSVAGNLNITGPANGLMLNYLLPVDNADSVVHNYKIATLPASASNTLDHLHLLVTVNNGWAAAQNAYIDATFANRAGFAYQYTVRGSTVSANAKLTAYQESGGAIDIYVGFGASSYSVASYTVIENVQETVYSSPTDVGSTPAGTLVFNSSSPSYPPATYSGFNGNVGINTSSPGAKLEVNGSIKLTAGSGASITFQDGSVQSTAYTGVTCGGDYAESVDVAGNRKSYEPGDVLVLSADKTSDVAGSDVVKSSEPYSTMVAGIYSTKPGVVGRRQITDPKTGTTEVPMAMVGIVPTKVNAENGSIQRGDLLVTSSTPGYAMKGTDRSRMLGAVVGKAMGTLDSGSGIIEVLVTLQ